MYYYTENDKIISGHFVPEMNKIVFDIIYKKITTGIWDWTVPKDIKPNHKFEEAWISRSK